MLEGTFDIVAVFVELAEWMLSHNMPQSDVVDHLECALDILLAIEGTENPDEDDEALPMNDLMSGGGSSRHSKTRGGGGAGSVARQSVGTKSVSGRTSVARSVNNKPGSVATSRKRTNTQVLSLSSLSLVFGLWSLVFGLLFLSFVFVFVFCLLSLSSLSLSLYSLCLSL